MSDKNMHQKINISWPASIMTIKRRIMLTEMPEVEWNRYIRSRNSGNIDGENLHISAVERKKSFLKN